MIAVRASHDGSFSSSDLIRGIEFSIRRGADVINMSLAGDRASRHRTRARSRRRSSTTCCPWPRRATTRRTATRVEFPAAAVGGRRGGRGIGLSVAATKPDGSVAPFSTHNDFVSIAAPGRERGRLRASASSPRSRPTHDARPGTRAAARCVFTGTAGARYAYGEGTSFAAPIVSGLAALAWQVERRLASEQVADVLTRSADGGGWNEFTGSGVVDGMAAVGARAPSTTCSARAPAGARDGAATGCA